MLYRGKKMRYIIMVLLFLSINVVYAQILDKPVATVKLTKFVSIGQRQLLHKVKLLEKQFGRVLSKKEKKELVESEIGEELLRQAAAKKFIKINDQKLDKYLETQRQSLGNVSEDRFREAVEEQTKLKFSDYREEIRKRLVQEQYIMLERKSMFSNIPAPSEADVKELFEKKATEFTNPVLIRFNHLYFDTRNLGSKKIATIKRTAQKLARAIATKKKTFEQALEESLDNVHFSGGDFGYLARDYPEQVALLGEKFITNVFKLRKGNISGLLESKIGYHIVQITDKRSAKLLTLDDPIFPGESQTVRDRIITYLRLAKQQELFAKAYDEVLKELMEKAEVRRFVENYNW